MYPVDDICFTDSFREKYDLGGRFIAVYGGSINVTQKIENIINLAESCIDYKDIVFCIIGGI